MTPLIEIYYAENGWVMRFVPTQAPAQDPIVVKGTERLVFRFATGHVRTLKHWKLTLDQVDDNA